MDFRFPTMRQCEEKFEKRRKELDLPLNVSLHHPPFFEGTGLKVEFQFRTVEEYQTILSFLSLLPEKREFQEMLEVRVEQKA